MTSFDGQMEMLRPGGFSATSASSRQLPPNKDADGGSIRQHKFASQTCDNLNAPFEPSA